jgi:hypothetical protein
MFGDHPAPFFRVGGIQKQETSRLPGRFTADLLGLSQSCYIVERSATAALLNVQVPGKVEKCLPSSDP